VRILLDTHVFLWWNSNPEMISPALRAAIREPANGIFVSAASVWEIAIKRAIGKLAFAQRIVGAIAGHRFELLPITGDQAEHAGELPRHHADPFDRMILAQAVLEGMVLGTQDARMRPYAVAILGL
jgi:PIN domain nuclease of toxin-antitoxin system